ncbi:DNA-binding response regulator [Micromonospora sp. NPDC047793]|uniref:DNA-binding response regulator n=1 Tax=unclassified Micromonospora TaxID=2617518 RepID=UPI0033E3B58C
MTGHVAVIDPLPMYQQGVAATLSALGHVVETPADPLTWIRHSPCAVVLLTLISQTDWELLGRLRDADARPPVIALIEEEFAALGVRAVRAGAQSILPRQATQAALQRTVEATLDGQAVLPAEVAAALALGAELLGPGRPTPSKRQLEWLRQLAAGSTVAQLAQRTGYSERAMFRLLQALYQEMDVRTRIEAIILARDLGWLPGAPRSRPTTDPEGDRKGRAG